MSKGPQILTTTFDTIFGAPEKNKTTRKHSNKPKIPPKKELELALVVLLVDLASCDQNFDTSEFNIIALSLHRVFGTNRNEVIALVNQAKLILQNLRGTAKFATLLKENLDLEKRKLIMEVIETVIQADGVENGFETYLRAKFTDQLGMNEKK